MSVTELLRNGSRLSAWLAAHSPELRAARARLAVDGRGRFGIIVDGAVILVEHLFHKLSPSDQHTPVDNGKSLVESVFDAAKEVARPTLFSLLIIIAAYLPIFSLQRVEGRIFSPLANTVVSALIGALFMTFTLVPVLCLIALRKPKKMRESPLLVWAQRAFDPTLRFAMNNIAVVLILAMGALGSAVMLLPRLGSEFLPALNEGALYVTVTLPGNMWRASLAMLSSGGAPKEPRPSPPDLALVVRRGP